MPRALQQATEFLVNAHNPATWLEIADSYLKAKERLGSRFVLPTEHEVLAPLIDTFAKDHSAFVEYVKALREKVPDAQRTPVHEIFRRLETRRIQLGRRRRISTATDMACADFRRRGAKEFNWEKRSLISRRIEQRWGQMRLAAATNTRDDKRNNQLTAEERAEVFDSFWKWVDGEIASGCVPLGPTPEESTAYLDSIYKEVV